MKPHIAVRCLLALMILISCSGAYPQMEKTYEFEYAEIENLEIDGDLFDVEISGASRDGVSGTIVTSDSFVLKHAKEGATLRVWHEIPAFRLGARKIHRLSLIVPDSATVHIVNSSGNVVIASMRSSSISIKTSSGGISGKDIASTTPIILKTSSGAIVLSGIRASVKANSTSGNQQYEDVRGSITAKSSSGAIQGTDIECTGSSTFQSSSGGIQIAFTNPLSDFSFDLKSSSGKLIAGKVNGSKKLVSGSGAIRINGSSTSGKQSYNGTD